MLSPIKSKPALQKAEMEWNTEYHSPRPRPSSGQKRNAKISVPRPSMAKAVFKIKPVIRTIPPTWGAEMDSCMTQRCFRLMRFPEKINMATAMVTTPMPPT